jgi:hypothetical protein
MKPRRWLLLIHQIPPRPNYLRIKIWRRLQQVGAAPIKQSVYALPATEASREDFGWLLKEITVGGGDAFIAESEFLEGLTDPQIVQLFQVARKTDYDKLIAECHEFKGQLDETKNRPSQRDARILRTQRRLEEITAIDFFNAPERATAEKAVLDLRLKLTGSRQIQKAEPLSLARLKGKTWVTRPNIFVDRIACAWLIRRFIDEEAEFRFVPAKKYAPSADTVGFDLTNGQFGHEGDRCTFEVLLDRTGLRDRALRCIAEMVHDVDLKDDKFGRSETPGLNALLLGLVESYPDDPLRLQHGGAIFENLYAYFRRRRRAT